jgi:hypothetical protein
MAPRLQKTSNEEGERDEEQKREREDTGPSLEPRCNVQSSRLGPRKDSQKKIFMEEEEAVEPFSPAFRSLVLQILAEGTQEVA